MRKAKQKRKAAFCNPDLCHKSTSYRVFFHVEGQEDDVRRFVHCTSFGCFQNKLEEMMYPKLKENTLIFTWKDNANFMVTIANDEDFILAVTEMSGPIYNIHVKKGVVEPKVASRRTITEWENIIKERLQKAVDQKDALLQQVIQERDALRRELDRARDDHARDRDTFRRELDRARDDHARDRDTFRRELDRARDDHARDREGHRQTIDRQQTLIEHCVGSQQKSRPVSSLGIQSDDVNTALSILGAHVPGTSSQTNQGGLEHNERVQLQIFLKKILLLLYNQ